MQPGLCKKVRFFHSVAFPKWDRDIIKMNNVALKLIVAFDSAELFSAWIFPIQCGYKQKIKFCGWSANHLDITYTTAERGIYLWEFMREVIGTKFWSLQLGFFFCIKWLVHMTCPHDLLHELVAGISPHVCQPIESNLWICDSNIKHLQNVDKRHFEILKTGTEAPLSWTSTDRSW